MTWNPIWSGPRAGPAWVDYCNGHPVATLLGLQAVAAMLAMPDDAMPNTAGINVQFLRPAMPMLELRGRGGKALVFVRAEVLSDGRLAATADATFAVLSPDRVSLRQPAAAR